jgi:tRNA/rRNA methyltransferase
MLEQIQIVLVRPESGSNVGAVCRAMKTMGISALIIVDPGALDEERVKTLAIHAWDIYKQRREYQTLDGALTSSVLSLGITRRRGRFRKYISLLPEEAADKAAQIGAGTVSLVFGNERTGLTDEELNQCDAAVHIPSSPAFPSLNLSHAVQIMTYALFRAAEQKEGRYHPVTREILEEVTGSMVNSLESIGFFSLTGKDEMHRYFRDLLARAAPDEREAERMKEIFKKIAGLYRSLLRRRMDK